MMPIKQPGKKTEIDTPSASSRQTRAIGETTLNSLPLLTEIVVQSGTDLPHQLNMEELQQLQRQLEARIETMFTQKLGLRLEQLQRQTIDQALYELKTELPQLVRDALNQHLESS